jgi:hypothetical protein
MNSSIFHVVLLTGCGSLYLAPAIDPDVLDIDMTTALIFVILKFILKIDC